MVQNASRRRGLAGPSDAFKPFRRAESQEESGTCRSAGRRCGGARGLPTENWAGRKGEGGGKSVTIRQGLDPDGPRIPVRGGCELADEAAGDPKVNSLAKRSVGGVQRDRTSSR